MEWWVQGCLFCNFSLHYSYIRSVSVLEISCTLYLFFNSTKIKLRAGVSQTQPLHAAGLSECGVP